MKTKPDPAKYVPCTACANMRLLLPERRANAKLVRSHLFSVLAWLRARAELCLRSSGSDASAADGNLAETQSVLACVQPCLRP